MSNILTARAFNTKMVALLLGYSIVHNQTKEGYSLMLDGSGHEVFGSKEHEDLEKREAHMWEILNDSFLHLDWNLLMNAASIIESDGVIDVIITNHNIKIRKSNGEGKFPSVLIETEYVDKLDKNIWTKQHALTDALAFYSQYYFTKLSQKRCATPQKGVRILRFKQGILKT